MKYKFLSALLIALAACSSSSSPNNTDAGSVKVMVTYQGTQHAVDIAPLAATTVNGAPVILLSTIVQAGLPSVQLANLQATDLVAVDGFRSSAKANCQSILPLAGSILERGWVDADQNVWWPEDLAYPGCLNVHGLAEMVIADK